MKKRFLPTKFDTFEHVTTCCLRNVCVTVHAVLDIWKECLNPDIYFLIKNQCTYTYHARIVWKRRVKFKFPLFSVNTPLTNRKWSTSGVCDNRCSVEARRVARQKWNLQNVVDVRRPAQGTLIVPWKSQPRW